MTPWSILFPDKLLTPAEVLEILKPVARRFERAVDYIEAGDCRLVSRNRHAFQTFEPLARAIPSLA